MKGLILFAIVFFFIGCGGKVEQQAKYNYISAEDTAKLIRKTPEKVVLIDIQEKDDFAEEHLKGAIPTYAYPVKTEEEKIKIGKYVSKITMDQTVVVICPKGGGGANRAYDFLLSQGVKKDKLFTLTDGQYGWPREKITDVIIQQKED